MEGNLGRNLLGLADEDLFGNMLGEVGGELTVDANR